MRWSRGALLWTIRPTSILPLPWLHLVLSAFSVSYSVTSFHSQVSISSLLMLAKL